MKEKRTLHELGAFVHGALATLHTLGIVYNLKRGNHYQAGIHACGAGYSLWATNHHINETKEDNYDVLHNFV